MSHGPSLREFRSTWAARLSERGPFQAGVPEFAICFHRDGAVQRGPQDVTAHALLLTLAHLFVPDINADAEICFSAASALRSYSLYKVSELQSFLEERTLPAFTSGTVAQFWLSGSGFLLRLRNGARQAGADDVRIQSLLLAACLMDPLASSLTRLEVLRWIKRQPGSQVPHFDPHGQQCRIRFRCRLEGCSYWLSKDAREATDDLHYRLLSGQERFSSKAHEAPQPHACRQSSTACAFRAFRGCPGPMLRPTASGLRVST